MLAATATETKPFAVLNNGAQTGGGYPNLRARKKQDFSYLVTVKQPQTTVKLSVYTFVNRHDPVFSAAHRSAHAK